MWALLPIVASLFVGVSAFPPTPPGTAFCAAVMLGAPIVVSPLPLAYFLGIGHDLCLGYYSRNGRNGQAACH